MWCWLTPDCLGFVLQPFITAGPCELYTQLFCLMDWLEYSMLLCYTGVVCAAGKSEDVLNRQLSPWQPPKPGRGWNQTMPLKKALKEGSEKVLEIMENTFALFPLTQISKTKQTMQLFFWHLCYWISSLLPFFLLVPLINYMHTVDLISRPNSKFNQAAANYTRLTDISLQNVPSRFYNKQTNKPTNGQWWKQPPFFC